MNDRVSAAPPVQFLGPEALANFEHQFYTAPERQQHQPNPNHHREQRALKRNMSLSRRRERPHSAEGQLRSLPYSAFDAGGDHPVGQQPQLSPRESEEGPDQLLLQQKKAGFLGRVRDAFGFGRTHKHASKVQQEIQKRASLQVLPTPASTPSTTPTAAAASQTQPIPIPLPKTSARSADGSLAEGHLQHPLQQFPASFHGTSIHSDRPSRDEILQSYNQLMASGFFKAHAIQSTRQPPPGASQRVGGGRGGRGGEEEGRGGGRGGEGRRRAPPPAPLALLSSHVPPPPPHRRGHRVSLSAPNSPLFGSGTGYVPAAPPPVPTHQAPAAPLPPAAARVAATEVKPKSSWESLRDQLRGSRKRARAMDSDDNASLRSESSLRFQEQQVPPAQAPTSAPSNAAGVVAGIGRRVSKKLRKMPSIISGQIRGGADGQPSHAVEEREDPQQQHHEHGSSSQQQRRTTTKKRNGPHSYGMLQQPARNLGTGSHGRASNTHVSGLGLSCVAPRTPSTPGPIPRLRKRLVASPSSSPSSSSAATIAATSAATVAPPASSPYHKSSSHHQHRHQQQTDHHSRLQKVTRSHDVTKTTGLRQQPRQQQTTRAFETTNWEPMDVDDDEQHEMSVDDDVDAYGDENDHYEPNGEDAPHQRGECDGAEHDDQEDEAEESWLPAIDIDLRVGHLLQRGRLGVPPPTAASGFAFGALDAALAAPPTTATATPLRVVPDADTNQRRSSPPTLPRFPFDFGSSGFSSSGSSCGSPASSKRAGGVWDAENADLMVTTEEVGERAGVQYGEAL